MTEEDVLDLSRIGVEAADDEHVLAAADDLEIARRVDEADVTRAEPARRGEGLGRGLGVIEIPGHDAAAAQHHFARLAGWDLAPVFHDAQLEAGPGPPHRGGDRLHVVAGRGGHRGARFGQAVAGHDGGERQLIVDSSNQLDRDVGRAGDGHPQGGEVECAPVGMVED